jgi:hypothetical protein
MLHIILGLAAYRLELAVADEPMAAGSNLYVYQIRNKDDVGSTYIL